MQASRDLIWHPYTRNSAAEAGLPVMVRGEGPYLYDATGKRYIDAISSWWACSLGHSHPAVVKAIQRQAEDLQHSILGNLSHDKALDLARELVDLTGGGRHVHFASDGACAVEASLKIAIQYWENQGQPSRKTFMALSDPYHGDTLGAVSVGYMEAFHKPFRSLLFKSYQAPFPDCRSCGRGRHDCDQPCIAATETLLREKAPELAAVVVEPLCQGAAGMRMYGPGYLVRLAELCEELGVLLIVDEVATGFCKTGAWFAYQHAGIEPDMVCVGKAMSAGYLPISATIVKDRIYDTFTDAPDDRTFYHGHTFAGNPLAAAAALAAISVYREQNMSAKAQHIGDLLMDNLHNLKDLSIVREVRGLGAIGAVELAPEAEPGRIRDHLVSQGILARPMGHTLYLMPPLVSQDELVLGLCRSLSEAIRTEDSRVLNSTIS